MNNNAMFKISYGLFVLSARDGDKDNGCIINTAQQVTVAPNRITVAVNKVNHTHDMIEKTGVFNLSVLDQSATFDTFKTFGFQSGRDTDKFAGIEFERSPNGLAFLPKEANSYISGKVVSTVDLGTHSMFVADVTDAEILSAVDSTTYDYYQKHIKPAPPKTEKKGWICKICGYVYEGDELPEDYICPLCKHGAVDFERIK